MENLCTKVYLRNCPISSLKIRTVVDLIRGENVSYGLSMLKMHSKKTISEYLSKLIKSGIASWKEKHSSLSDVDFNTLYISEVQVSQGSYVKRMRAASRGRVHRIKRPYSHVALTIKKACESNNVSAADNNSSDKIIENK